MCICLTILRHIGEALIILVRWCLTPVLGLQQDPNLSNYMTTFQDPVAQNELAQKMKALKEDPELAPILKEIEEMGPAAMMK